MRKLLKKMNFVPDKMVTDDLRSYGRPVVILESPTVMNVGGGVTTERRAQPTRRRERKVQRLKSAGVSPAIPVLPRGYLIPSTFSPISTSASTHRVFRASAMQTWREVTAAA
jgi:putative transposase